jgi:hypothetical protein
MWLVVAVSAQNKNTAPFCGTVQNLLVKSRLSQLQITLFQVPA